MEQTNNIDISQLHTWPRYKDDIVRVILEALTILKERDDLIADEVDLNRKLFFCFKRATYKLRLPHHLPAPEANNPPYEDDEHRALRENKRPDFYWQFSDSSVNDPTAAFGMIEPLLISKHWSRPLLVLSLGSIVLHTAVNGVIAVLSLNVSD